jgi:hypothetical protein
MAGPRADAGGRPAQNGAPGGNGSSRRVASLAEYRRKRHLSRSGQPLGYANFEGAIRSGEYGAGQVIVWDRGFFVNRSHDRQGQPVEVEAALECGHLTFELYGKKLRGGYSLTQMRGRGGDQWLLVKTVDRTADDFADARRRTASTQPASVLSGLTIRLLRGEKDT